ncbi:MAG: hypothetical protein WC107_05825 [Patescibacteria group bacterium]|jgi:hypothetical protein
MKITPNPELFDKAVAAGRVKNMRQVAGRSGLNYQTVMKLTGRDKDETFSPKTFETLAAYFDALGYTADEIANMPMGHVFDIKYD